MGLLSLLQRLKKDERECRIILLGLDNSGKTTVLRQLGGEDISQISPTQGFNVKSLQKEHCRLTMWDIGGQKTIRPYWRNYFNCTDAIIFVVDSTDNSRMNETGEELTQLLQEDTLRGVPLLVLANKQDLLNSLSPEDIGRRLNMSQISSCEWKIQPCSARDGEGLTEGLEWVMSKINAK